MSTPRDPEEVTAAGAPAVAAVPADTRMGAVHLSVSDLERSVAYYERAIGLRVHGRGDGRAALGAGGEDLLVLARGAGRAARARLLRPLPLRPARARARPTSPAGSRTPRREQVPIVGVADHFVSEAIYLSDPDEHGIEVYWDRPREVWEGQVAERMTTLPLDVGDLLGVLDDPRSEPFDGLAAGTVMGHVHLRVAEIPATTALLLRRARLRADGGVRRAGVVHERRRLPPPPRREHVGEPRPPPPPPGHATLEQVTIVLPDGGATSSALAHEAAAVGAEPEPRDGRRARPRPVGQPGAAGGAARRREPPARASAAPPRRAEQPRVVRDDAGDPEALELRDPVGVVDRPDVELAAGVVDRGARAARSRAPSGT